MQAWPGFKNEIILPENYGIRKKWFYFVADSSSYRIPPHFLDLATYSFILFSEPQFQFFYDRPFVMQKEMVFISLIPVP